MRVLYTLGCLLVIQSCHATKPFSPVQPKMEVSAAQTKFLKSDVDFDRTKGKTLKLPSDLSRSQTRWLKSDVNFERSKQTSREFPCPVAEAIAPCICEYDAIHQLHLDCSEVDSNEQLETILSQDFPAKEFYQFNLHYNNNITFVASIPSGLNFQGVYFFFDENLQLISDEFLLGSVETLEYFTAYYSQLHRSTFPFAALPLFTKLKELNLLGTSTLTSLPKLQSDTLTDVTFSECSIDFIEPGTFDEATQLDKIVLEFNSLTYLVPNNFLLTDDLRGIYLGYNSIANITPGAFVLADDLQSTSVRSSIHLYHNNLTELLPGTFPMADRSTGIYVSDNQIAEIAPGTFVLPNTTDHFDLSLGLYNNNLTILDEDVFEEIFPYLFDFWIEGNPLTCGCSLAWLLLNDSFMATISDSPTCANGTLLTDLDTSYYQMFC